MQSSQPAGEEIGAVDFPVDATEETLAALRVRVAQCRRLAAAAGDQRTADTLHAMAAEYEEQARRIERPN
jgi:hypothetical protein